MCNNVLSPCIDRCSSNGVNCPSCGRTIEEIQEWLDATESRKEKILEECVKRLDPIAYDYWKELYDHKKEDNKTPKARRNIHQKRLTLKIQPNGCAQATNAPSAVARTCNDTI